MSKIFSQIDIGPLELTPLKGTIKHEDDFFRRHLREILKAIIPFTKYILAFGEQGQVVSVLFF